MTKKTLAFLLALSPLIAEAQISAPRVQGGGGSSSSTITAGTTATSGCTDGGFLYSLSSLVQCGANAINSGSTVTIGGGISGTNKALIVNNATSTGNILEAQDNGTAVFTIADGGVATFTQRTRFTAGLDTGDSSTGAIYIGVASFPAQTFFMNSTVNTPDSSLFAVGTTSRAIQFAEAGDEGFDFQNACTTGLGTAACTDTTLIVHSHNQDTGEFLSFAHDGKAGVIAGGDSTTLNSQIRLGGSVALPDTTATTVITVPSANVTGSGGTIEYVVTANDATNAQSRSGKVRYAVATNSSGTTSCAVYGSVTTQAAGGDTTNPANPTQVQDGSGAGAFSSGTLTYAWSVTAGTNTCAIKIGSISSLTETTMRIDYVVVHSGRGAVTGG